VITEDKNPKSEQSESASSHGASRGAGNEGKSDRAPPDDRSVPEQVGMGEVVDLAWPITVSMLSFTAMGVADTLFVSRLGTEPLAAVGMAVSTTFLILAFGMGLMGGVKVAVAQSTGAGKHGLAKVLGWQGLWVAAGVGGLLALLAPLGPAIFELMGGEDDVKQMANLYFVIRVLGAPLTFGVLALKGWFDGTGDTKTPMKANLLANGLNIALDPIFIFGWGPVPAFGVGGAAASTVIAITVALIFVGWRARRHLGGDVSRRPDTDLLREIWRLGSPMGVRQLLGVGAWVVLISVLARVGAIDLAAHVMVIRIVSMSFLPGYAVSEAASVLVGQSVGAGRPLAARQAWRHSMVLGIGMMAFFGVIFVVMPEPIIGLFSAEADVAELAVTLMMIAAGFQVFDAVAMVSQGALNGAGDTRFTMVTSVLAAWFIQLPITYVLAVPMEMGAVGAWWGLTVEIAALAVISLWRIRGSEWLERAAPVIVADEELEAIVASASGEVPALEVAANEAPAA